MKNPPMILVSSCAQRAGLEMRDLSTSLSEAYSQALTQAGGLPLILPCSTDPGLIVDCIRRADGLLLTGGDDVCPDLYDPKMPADLRAKVQVEGPERDLRELLLIEECFRQHKPLLAICRGHQMLNVAFGGTLIADIPSQRSSSLAHRRMDAKRQVVHEVEISSGSLLSRVAGGSKLGVNSTHHQAVDRVAGPLVAVARAPDGIVEALELKPSAQHCLPFLLSVQFHPERLLDRHPEHAAIFAAFINACRGARAS